MNQRTLTLALAAATALGAWALAEEKHPPKKTGGAAPATQPSKPGVLAHQSPEDAALPAEMHHRHVALRHITLARNLLKETKDGGEDRNHARTELNLAINQLYKSMGMDSPIDKSDDDKDKNDDKKMAEQYKAYANVGSAAKAYDTLPKEHRELHAAVYHLNIAKAVLEEAPKGGDRKEEAIEQVDNALTSLNKALGTTDKDAKK